MKILIGLAIAVLVFVVCYAVYRLVYDGKTLDVQNETVKKLHSWVSDTDGCYSGIKWEFNFSELNDTSNLVINKDNINDYYKMDLVFRQLELEGALTGHQDEEFIITTSQFENAMKKIFGDVIDYDKLLTAESVNYYKNLDITYDTTNKQFKVTDFGTGCEGTGSKSLLEKAVEQNDTIILTVKVEEYAPEEESTYYTYNYTFKQKNGNYYLYSVAK